MKVAFFVADNREPTRDYASPVPWFGTAPEALLEGFKEMADLEVHVVSCTQQPMRSPAKLADNIWFHSLHVPKLGWMRTGYQGCIRAHRRKVAEIKPDLVHGQGTERDSSISAVCSAYPSVVTIHGNMAELARLFKAPIGSFGWLTARLENFTLKRTLGVLCNSEYTERLVRPRARRTWRVPNPIRGAFFTQSKPPAMPGKCILMNVGVIQERKRTLELLEMAGHLHKQGLDFEIQFVGKGDPDAPYVRSFMQKVKQAEAAGYARYLGSKSTDELIECFDAAHGLVHFPVEEAFGLVVAEALARELKFFGANVGGIKDICGGIPSAQLFEPGDWEGLATAMATWIKQGHPLAPEAVESIRERYHPRSIALRHMEIYREVLRGLR
jgi:glycosyltransferase involved in cell wall biosynthesis